MYIKKIVIKIFIFCLIFFPVCVEAKIEKQVDNFSGDTTITSNIGDKIAPFRNVIYCKFLMKNHKIPGYALYFVIIDNEWWFFSKQNADLKIDDDNTIYELKVMNTYERLFSTGSLCTQIALEIPQNLINLFLNSKKMIFRVYFTNNPPITWEVPKDVLSEWKRVIEMK